jgi:hypothetical protein
MSVEEANNNFIGCIESQQRIEDMKKKSDPCYLVNPANFVRKSLKSFEGESASRNI